MLYVAIFAIGLIVGIVVTLLFGALANGCDGHAPPTETEFL